MSEHDEDKVSGRIHGEQFEAEPDSIWMRLLYMLIIALMISVAQTVLGGGDGDPVHHHVDQQDPEPSAGRVWH